MMNSKSGERLVGLKVRSSLESEFRKSLSRELSLFEKHESTV